MIKKIAFAGVGLAFLASPFLASAQTTSASSENPLIAVLTQLVQILEQELQQLLAMHGTTSTTQPTQASVVSPASTLSLLTFVSPESGAQISATQLYQIQWQLTDSSITQTFPAANTYVVLHIISSSGQDVGSIGDGYLIGGTSATWNIASDLNTKLYSLTSGAQYKIRAMLKYQPANFTCDPSMPAGPKDCVPLYSATDKALIAEANQYQSDSDWFTVNLNGYARPIATIDAGSALSGTASGVSTVNLQIWMSNTPNVINVSVPVINGKWSYTPASSMPSGTYEVNVWTPDNNTSLMSGTFVIS